MMLVLEVLAFAAALFAVALLTLYQVLTQIKEYRFYERNGWDFSRDSGLDKIDQRIAPYPLPITHWQRFYLFRPFYILMLFCFMAGMIFLSRA